MGAECADPVNNFHCSCPPSRNGRAGNYRSELKRTINRMSCSDRGLCLCLFLSCAKVAGMQLKMALGPFDSEGAAHATFSPAQRLFPMTDKLRLAAARWRH